MTREEEIQMAAKEITQDIEDWEVAEDIEDAFMQGALWADRTMIDKACEWLDNELPKYVMEGREGRPYISVALVDDFKKAMKGD